MARCSTSCDILFGSNAIRHCEEHFLRRGNPIWVAYSGGVDSHVLLHSLARGSDSNATLHAIHIHHGLQPAADEWARHCQSVCDSLNVPLEIVHLHLKPKKGESIEAVARLARYQALASFLQVGDVLVTGHHQDDQAETFLLQLLRGAGVRGLAAMAERTPLGKGVLCRPFLNMSRAQILEEANQLGLVWVEDPTNQSTQLSRNLLRQTILPLLKKNWPATASKICAAAFLCADTLNILDEYLGNDLQQCRGSQPQTLSIQALLLRSERKRLEIIRHALKAWGLPLPNAKKLLQIHHMCFVKPGAMPKVVFGGAEARRFRDDLYLQPIHTTQPVAGEWVWHDLMQPLEIAPLQAKLHWRAEVCNETIVVRSGVGGDTVKKFFQRQGVPPWLRPTYPLVFVEGEFIDKIPSLRNAIHVESLATL